MKKTIQVQVFSMNKGIEVYENINFIRIKSNDYNLLIMEDYVPVLGEIHGTIDIESEETSVKLENIDGYYMSKNNEFYLILRNQ